MIKENEVVKELQPVRVEEEKAFLNNHAFTGSPIN
jgi:hypothetical protein